MSISKMPNTPLYIIGLTGNIACGKSTVVNILRELGAATIDADSVTHALQQPGQEVYRQIVATFGEGILTEPGGPINRRALAAIVFSDPNELRRLEQIVHPAVRTTIHTWLDQLAKQASETTTSEPNVAVIDAIKLLEGGWRAVCDTIWVVTCPIEQQVARLVTTRGMDEAEARRRIAAQPPQAEKVAQADLVIDNSGSLAATRQQVLAGYPRTSS